MGILEDSTVRRSIIGLMLTLTLGILVVPRVSHAQQPAKVPRIGILMSVTPEMGQHLFEAFRHGLREQGRVEGQTILLEPRWAEGKLERFADLAAELVRLKVDLLFTPSTPRDACRPSRHADDPHRLHIVCSRRGWVCPEPDPAAWQHHRADPQG